MSVRVIEGDCRAVLLTLPASVHCVVTSPPYWGLRDYGVGGQIGLERTLHEYVAEMVAVFREVRRVLRDDGTLWLNLGDAFCGNGGAGGAMASTGLGSPARAALPRPEAADPERFGRWRRDYGGLKNKDLMMIPARVALALQDDGWWLRSDIIWAKPNPMPESVTDRPTSSHEHIFLLTKSARYFFDAEAVREPSEQPDRVRADKFGGASWEGRQQHSEGALFTGGATRNIRNVWEIATAPFPEAHFATFPPELAERCIKAGTSERGCCPACGAPWVRQTEARFVPQQDVSPERGVRCAEGQKPMDASSGWPGVPRGTTERKTTGWRPSCSCPEAPPVPCIVLDLFGGAGTTGLVADRLQRDAVLIELNPVYAAMARSRILADAPLLVAAE